jgi:hypothetical protein
MIAAIGLVGCTFVSHTHVTLDLVYFAHAADKALHSILSFQTRNGRPVFHVYTKSRYRQPCFCQRLAVLSVYMQSTIISSDFCA